MLVIPHYIVLAFLWIGFGVLTAVAWVAIVATARYPRRIFDFNVGVLRWTWRVGLLGGGGTALWAQAQRHGGYVDFGTTSYSTPGYALASDTIGMHVASGGWGRRVGPGRHRAHPDHPGGERYSGVHRDRSGRSSRPLSDRGGPCHRSRYG